MKKPIVAVRSFVNAAEKGLKLNTPAVGSIVLYIQGIPGGMDKTWGECSLY